MIIALLIILLTCRGRCEHVQQNYSLQLEVAQPHHPLDQKNKQHLYQENALHQKNE